MALNIYTAVVDSDDGNIYNDRPRRLTLPTDETKYIAIRWSNTDTFEGVANIVYGTPELYWLILETNKLINPFEDYTGRIFKILLKEHLNEVV